MKGLLRTFLFRKFIHTFEGIIMFGLKSYTSNKNWKDLFRLFRNHRCEIDDSGDLRIGAAKVGGDYWVRGENGLWVQGHNTGTYEGYNYILRCVFGGNSPPASMYLAPFAANVTPLSTWTIAIWISTATEATTTYSEATRQAFVESTPADGSTNNYSSPATFTAASATTWYGFGVMNTATKGDSSTYPTQALIAGAKFATAESLSGAGAQLSIKYRYYLQPIA